MARPKEGDMFEQKIYTINSLDELKEKLEIEIEDKKYEIDYIKSMSKPGEYAEYIQMLKSDLRELESVYFSFFDMRYEVVH